MTILGVMRRQEGDSVYLRATLSFGNKGGDYETIEGRLCSANELASKSAEDEDKFALRLARRAERKRFWKSLYRKLTFKP